MHDREQVFFCWHLADFRKTISARYYFVKDLCDTNSSVTRNYLKNSKNVSLCIPQPLPLGAPAACAATAQGQEYVLNGWQQQQQQHQKATAHRRRGGQAHGPRGRDCKGPSGGVIEASCIGDYWFVCFHKFICIALIKN